MDRNELQIELELHIINTELKTNRELGGEGSGNFGHAGIPGEQGGSAPGGGVSSSSPSSKSSSKSSTTKLNKHVEKLKSIKDDLSKVDSEMKDIDGELAGMQKTIDEIKSSPGKAGNLEKLKSMGTRIKTLKDRKLILSKKGKALVKKQKLVSQKLKDSH